MAVDIKRKPNENTYSLLRRFSDKVKKGRVLTLAKKNMRFEKDKNEHFVKKEALRRKKWREKREYLIKIGKISDEPTEFVKNNKKKR